MPLRLLRVRWLIAASAMAGVASLAGGCGRIGFAADDHDSTDDDVVFDAARVVDGSTDANSTITCGPFGAFQRLDSIVSPGNDDFSSFISNDGLVLIFTSNRSGGRALFQTTRASVTDDFATPTSLVVPSGNDDDAWMSPNGLTLYFNRNVAMVRSIRASTSDPFEDIESTAAEFRELIEPDFSDDLLTFVGTQYPDPPKLSIGRRTSTELPFTQFELQSEPNENTPCCATLAPDNLQLIYTSDVTTLKIATWDGAAFTNSIPFAPLGAVRMADAYWGKSGRFMMLSAVVPPSTNLHLYLATADCS